MYTATLEEVCSHVLILRIHQEPYCKFGDPYIWWTVVNKRSLDIVELKGADKELPGPSAARAICLALKRHGFKKRWHERIVNGESRWVLKRL